MSAFGTTALTDFVRHRLTPARFLDGLGIAWRSDASGLCLEATNLPSLSETISVRAEDVVTTLKQACARKLDRRTLRLWASIILLTDYFTIEDSGAVGTRELALEALHWLASSDEDEESFLREAGERLNQFAS